MNPRKLALDAIGKILNKGGYSNIVINEYLNKYEFNEEDRKLFTKLVLGTVEKKLTLKYYLEPFLKKKQKSWVLNLLMMSIYQLIELNIPDYAVVNEAVEIARLKDHYVASFVNAVLRNFLRNDLRSFDNLNEIETLSIKYSYPLWLVTYFLKDYDYEVVEKIFQEFDKVKNDAIRVNTLKTTKDEVIKILEENNIRFEESIIVENGLVVKESLVNHKLFKEGKIIIQDLASQLVSEIIDPKEGSIILDLCSAPGVKASHLASLMNNTGEIYACDIYKHKLKLMEENFNRLGVKNVNIQLIDARKVKDFVKEESFDYVVADLPCSGLGVLGHKVDLKYHITYKAISEIIKLQKEILESSYMLVKKGGFFIISTCTLNKLENEKQVEAFLENHPEFEIVYQKTIMPYEFHTDGFYICKLRRL
ncbi:MAG TPA: 16S rRNA (cytosine(967)-C(5))-methyltransferase RsmB [Acholeplasmataceae bacterium]|jgi:16S rRNA (cytosine967-C5)-methyltransferase|nr:16S rRNA (cytosine(967)-C(5))-methyltransferase RsmB [Acholeplasmataceae bacterium]